MSSESLIRAMPDLVIGIRRDGVILDFNAGHGVGELRPSPASVGKNIEEVWPQSVAELVKQLTRKAIATRTTAEARFQDRGHDYDVRASAQGPDRALCVIRPAAASDPLSETVEATAERLAPQIDRRGFLRRFRESVSMAALREKPLAIAVIHIDGIADIAQAIAPKVSEQIMTAAIVRFSATPQDGPRAEWYLGQLSDSLLAVVVESADRAVIEPCVSTICASLREPVQLAGDVYQLRPSAGIAILGQDASSARALLDHARAAVNEARRGGGQGVSFFTDTLRMKSLARLDIARELQDAIANEEIKLRYVGRHELATGRLVACVAYLRWQHPLRGEIRPLEFLRVAETTGIGTSLSRAAMQWLQEDYEALNRKWGPGVRISFGALRHHLANEEFIGDFERLIAAGTIPPERLELRVPEKYLAVRQPGDFRPLADAGVQLILDEVGRGAISYDWLARAPLHGLQLDRSLVAAARQDAVARRVCQATVAAANALNLMAIAPGIDDNEQLKAMGRIGCRQGSGDVWKAHTAI